MTMTTTVYSPRNSLSRSGLPRMVWVGVIVVALVLFAIGIPARFAQLLAFGESYVRPLRQLGLSPNLYALYISVLDLTIVLAHVAIATFILWHRAHDRIALLVGIALVTAPLSVTHALETSLFPWWILGEGVHYLGLLSSITLLYLFPDGRFIWRWSRLAVVLWAVLALPAVFLPSSPISLPAWPSVLQGIVLLGIV
ncbi:MAG: hypothetical protein M3220_11440, partial [Chloroflexota bacterium]|nr:hypothetical protein [Chloroflexota bacterium]